MCPSGQIVMNMMTQRHHCMVYHMKEYPEKTIIILYKLKSGPYMNGDPWRDLAHNGNEKYNQQALNIGMKLNPPTNQHWNLNVLTLCFCSVCARQ